MMQPPLLCLFFLAYVLNTAWILPMLSTVNTAKIGMSKSNLCGNLPLMIATKIELAA